MKLIPSFCELDGHRDRAADREPSSTDTAGGRLGPSSAAGAAAGSTRTLPVGMCEGTARDDAMKKT